MERSWVGENWKHSRNKEEKYQEAKSSKLSVGDGFGQNLNRTGRWRSEAAQPLGDNKSLRNKSCNKACPTLPHSVNSSHSDLSNPKSQALLVPFVLATSFTGENLPWLFLDLTTWNHSSKFSIQDKLWGAVIRLEDGREAQNVCKAIFTKNFTKDREAKEAPQTHLEPPRSLNITSSQRHSLSSQSAPSNLCEYTVISFLPSTCQNLKILYSCSKFEEHS